MVRQISMGEGYKYLTLSQPEWVKQIWKEGHFPFGAPFVYPSQQGWQFSFPAAFPFISAFFYTHFGLPGLYIFPVLSFLIFLVFVVYCLRARNTDPRLIAVTIFVLVFCSPLAIYGVSFWEHISAVLLLFFGIAFISYPFKRNVPSFLFGMASGMAVWLRPEAMIMNFLYGIGLLIMFSRTKRQSIIFFLSGLSISIAAFLLFNVAEYGSFFGIHGYQVLNQEPDMNFFALQRANLIDTNFRSIKYFPFIILLFPAFIFAFHRQSGSKPAVKVLILISLAFCLITPLFMPNSGGRQWGARYLLPVIPAVIILIVFLLNDNPLFLQGRRKFWLVLVFMICTGYSFYRNTYKGGIKTVRWENIHRIKPVLDFIDHRGDVVVIREGYIAMELAIDFETKIFFTADDDMHLNSLIKKLKQQGIRTFTYVYDTNNTKVLPGIIQRATVPGSVKGDFGYLKVEIGE
ncbi:MAG TPA: hypothetical protein VII44_10905 [Puia sp.]